MRAARRHRGAVAVACRLIAATSALETLFLPFSEGRLPWPAGGAMFLRARDGWPLHERPLPGLHCEQSFKPEADALDAGGRCRQCPWRAEDL